MHEQPQDEDASTLAKDSTKTKSDKTAEKEIGGFKDAGLPEPTRFGDWEVKGRCSDF